VYRGRGGRWYTPRCLESPCLVDPQIDHLDENASLCESTESRESCSFTCEQGFTPTVPAECVLGEWVNLDSAHCVAKCFDNPIMPGLVENITHCANTSSPASSGDTCNVSCIDGHSPNWHPHPLVTCMNGSWIGGECLPDPCLTDPPYAHLNKSASLCENTTSGNTCSYVNFFAFFFCFIVFFSFFQSFNYLFFSKSSAYTQLLLIVPRA